MKGIKRAFTLIELVVVITILAILGTIAFVSMEGYSKQARDSKRVSDIQNIKTTLELFALEGGKYPMVDDGEQVSFSGELLRTQGFLGDTVTTNLSRNLQKKPTDPLSNAEYIYSVTNVQTEFEVLSVYEGDMIVGSNLISNSYAVDNFKPKIDGTYNKVFVKSAHFIVPTPSIINSEILPLDFKTNPDAIDSTVISGGYNMPDVNIPRVNVQTGGLDINLSVYTGSIDSSSTDQEKIDAITAIQGAYSGTELADDDNYLNLLAATEDEDLIAIANFTILDTGTPPVIIGPVPTIAANGISFTTDTDTNIGQVGGDVTITKASDESDITHYVIYWGENETTKLTGGSVIATISKTGSDVTYTFPENTNIPASATHLLVFTKNPGGEMETGESVSINDNTSGGTATLPLNSALQIDFTDTDLHIGQIGGTVTVTKATDESDITDYVLYWGESAATKLGGYSAIATIPKTGGNITYTIPVDTSIPTNATHLLVFTKNANGEMVTGINYEIIDDDSSGKDINIVLSVDGRSDGALFEEKNGFLYYIDAPAWVGTYPDITRFRNLYKLDTNNNYTLIREMSYSGLLRFNANLVHASTISYFVGFDQDHGQELWKTDGTTAGTYMLKDINTGTGFSLEYKAFDSVRNNFLVDGDIFYFVANDGVHGKGLWRTDGTEVGTYLLKDIVTGGGDDQTYYLIKRGTDVYFYANNSEIWKTDGTIIGTTKLTTHTFKRPFLIGNDIYFGYSSSDGISKLDNSDIVTDITRTPYFTQSLPYTPYYSTLNTLYDGTYLYYNCLTDDNTIARQPGTISANRFVNCRRNMDTLENGIIFKNDILLQSTFYHANTSFIEMGGEKYVGCRLYSYTSGGYTTIDRLCKINSSSTDISIVFSSDVSFYDTFSKVVGSELFSYGYSSSYGGELYKTDGTTLVIVKDLNPGSGSGFSGKPIVFNNKIYFLGTENGINYGIYSY